METHRPFSQLQAACSIRFNCQIRGQSQSYLAANLVLTVKSLYQRIMELTWEIFGSSGGPTDTKAALAVRSGAKLKDERQQGGSAPTASAPNQFPSGRNIQPGVYSYSMFNKSVPFWSKYTAWCLFLQHVQQISFLLVKIYSPVGLFLQNANHPNSLPIKIYGPVPLFLQHANQINFLSVQVSKIQ